MTFKDPRLGNQEMFHQILFIKGMLQQSPYHRLNNG